MSSLRVVRLRDESGPADPVVFRRIRARLIHKCEESEERVDVFRAQVEAWHPLGPTRNERPGVGLTAVADNIGQVRAHVAAQSIELVAGNAVVVLENLLAMPGLGTHDFLLSRGGATGVNVCRIRDERDQQRAEHNSIINGEFPDRREAPVAERSDKCI